MSDHERQRPAATALRIDVLDALREANPVPAHARVDARSDRRAQRDLDRILIGDLTSDLTSDLGDDVASDVSVVRRAAWRRPVPRVVAGVAAAVAAVAVGVAVAQPGPAPLARADTPPALAITAAPANTPGADTLRRLAALATQQEPLPPATWHYTETIDYNSVTSYYRRDGKDVTAFQVVPSRTRLWTAADGRGHLESVSAGGTDAWSSDGKIDESLIESAGTRTDDFTIADQDSSRGLPTDPVQLKALLEREEPDPPGGQVAGWFADLYNRFSKGLPTPAQQAALWQVLADTGDMSYLGTATDRAGRPALVLAYDTTGTMAGEQRFQLLIDPATGLLLAHEEIALKTSARWLMQAPAVMGGTTWLATGSTGSLTVPPATGTTPRG